MKKNVLKLLALFCMSLVCFIACDDLIGGGLPPGGNITDDEIFDFLEGLPTPVEPSVPETDEKIVLTVWESKNGPDEFIKEAGEAFSAKYPNVEIKFVNVESSDAANQIRLDGPNGYGPDLFAAQHDQVVKLFKDKLALPVSLSSEVKESLLGAGLQATTYNGISCGYPISAETYALYYNKDLISEDEVPSTWEELIDWTREFNENNPDKQGFLMEADNAYYSIIFTTANGNRLFGESGIDFSSSYLNTDAAIKGMETFQALSEVVDLSAEGLTAEYINTSFTEGKATMVISGPWILDYYDSKIANLGVTTLPALPGESTPAASFAGIRCMFVSAYSEHPEVAALFAEFLLTEEMQQLRYELTGGALPSIKMELEDENSTAFVEQLDYAFPMPTGKYMEKYWDVFGEFSGNIWDGADIKEELNKANGAIINSDDSEDPDDSEEPKVPVLDGDATKLTHFFGTMNEWKHEELGEGKSFEFMFTGGDQFKFSDGTDSYTAISPKVDALDTPIYLTRVGDLQISDGNITFAEGLLEVTATYKVTLVVNGATEAYFEVTQVQEPWKKDATKLTHFAGTMSGWEHELLEDGSFTFVAAGYDEFKYSVGDWDYTGICGEITALDEQFQLTGIGYTGMVNITFAEGVLTPGVEYKVSLEVISETEAYVSVSEVIPENPGEPENPSEPEIPVEPTECTLTVYSECGFIDENRNNLFDENGNLVTTITKTFISGSKFCEVWSFINPNIIDYYENEKEIYYGFSKNVVDENGTKISIDSDLTLTSNLSVSLEYIKVPYVTYDLNGGIIDDDVDLIQPIPFGEDIEFDMAQPTREGYIFAGWTLTKDGDDIVHYVTEDVIVYAKWLEIKYEAEPGKLYMIPYGDWVTGKEAYACWFWEDFQEGFWVPMTPKESDENNIKGLYEVTIPEGVDNVIFVAYDKTKELDWDAKLCQTSDFKIPTGNTVLYDTSRGCFVTPDGVVEEATPKSINDLTYFYGNMTDWNLPEKLVDGSFTFYAIGGDSFKFLASAWDVLEAGGVRVDALDSKIELQTAESGLDYITFNPGVLTVNAEYKVTLIIEDEKAFVKVEETGNAYPPSDEETKGFYRLTHITGSFADWVPNAYVLDENNSFIYESDGNEHLFKFSAGGWDFSIGNVCIDGVSTFELNSGGIADISGNGKILLPAGTYKITLEVLAEDSANVIVEAVEIPDTTDKIVLTVWESAGGPEYFIRQAGEAFSAKNPDVVIKFVNVESNDAANQILLDGPAGVGADLFAAQQDQLGKLLDNNIVLPTNLSTEAEESLLEVCRQSLFRNGEIYGYPMSAETYALYYNKDLISEDEVPSTWEELIDWTATFNKNNPGKQGFMMDVANAYYSIIFTTANGNRLFGESGIDFSSSYLNTDDAIKGMETFQALSEVVDLSAEEIKYIDTSFKEGNAAMVISGPWNLGNYEEAGINLGVTTLPVLPGDSTPAASFGGVRCMFVSAYSKHPETAAAFAEFLLTEEMQKLRYELTNGALPSIKMELEDENATGFIKQLDYAFPFPTGPYMDKYWEVFGATSANIWNGADIKTELDAANAAIIN